jgi:hypothetical protein
VKIRNLLDSLLKGFPIGGFYLWRPAEGMVDAKPRAFKRQRVTAPFEGYLVDGQQRLTSLEAAFGLYTGEDKDGSALRCYLDLVGPDTPRGRDTRLFVSYGGNKTVARRVESSDSTLVPLTLLFSGVDHTLRRQVEECLRLLAGWDSVRVEHALDRLDRAGEMLEQYVPCTTISDVTDEEAVEIFSRLNKGGSALSQGDVRAAELARGRAVQVLKGMRGFVAGERPRRLGFGFSFAFRALVLFHRQTAQFSTLKPDWMDAAGPHSRSLAESWRATEQAVDRALTFVDTEMGWSRRALLPSANAVIVLAAALEKAGEELTADDVQLCRRWLCLTALRRVFQGSVETTMNRFYRAIREARRFAPKALVAALRRTERRTIHPEEFELPAQMLGPEAQVMYAWLVSQGAKDWLSGEHIVTFARTGGFALPSGDLTIHHIFPRKLLSEVLDDPDDANTAANFALLSRSANSELAARRPDEVLAQLTSQQREWAAVQFFGEAAGDKLRIQHYDEFIEWRAARLASAINEWLGLR